MKKLNPYEVVYREISRTIPSFLLLPKSYHDHKQSVTLACFLSTLLITKNRVGSVLYTYFPYLADEEDFEKFRKAGITVSSKEILETLDFDDLPQRSGRENETHRALKNLGAKLLNSLGAFDVVFEHYSIDVSSRSLQIAIECGDTPISRVWSMLFNDFYSQWFKEVWCIYVNDNKKIEAVKFIKTQLILNRG